MADLNKMIDELSKLTVVEAADLSKQLEEKWGVTAAAPAAAAPAVGAAAPVEEKTDFTIFCKVFFKELPKFSNTIKNMLKALFIKVTLAYRNSKSL